MRSIGFLRAIRPVRGGSGLLLPLLLMFPLLAGGCRKRAAPESAAGVIVDPADIYLVELQEISLGPVISGSLRPVTEATLLAEVAGTVMSAPAREGQRVSAGELLAQISNAALPDQRRSAESAAASARIALGNAEREVARTETLVAAGALARRELENARSALATAQAQLATARAQQAEIARTLAATTVQATIPGVVSAKQVSTGDIVQLGTPLYTIIDPSSMMLEASLPAEQLHWIAPGAQVEFEVRGYPGRLFVGSVRRINPVVDPATRHVTIHISIPNPDGALIAGLFAEGRVTREAHNALVVPDAALQDGEAGPHVMRICVGRAEAVGVRTGAHDAEGQRTEILAGVALGDTLLIGPAMEIAPGTPVAVAAPRRGAAGAVTDTAPR